MQRAKRQRDDIVPDDDANKKAKLIAQNKSLLEDLANETLYEVFEYLDSYHLYHGFFDLNKRFQNLLLYSTLPIQITIPTMSKSDFERYHRDIIVPRRQQIHFLRVSNAFTVDTIFSPPRILSKFIRLEKLVLDHFHTKYLKNILYQLTLLPALHSLVLAPLDHLTKPNLLFSHIFRLSKLKYCKLIYQTKKNQGCVYIPFDDYDCSPMEHLIINARFPFDSLDELLFCLPRLRSLSIDCLVDMNLLEIPSDRFVLKHLKTVSLKLNNVYFDRLGTIIQNFFRRVRVLHLTTQYDTAYLNAEKWQQLIQSSMPKLRIFDLHYEDTIATNRQAYPYLINQFTSPFWIERQWFFTYRHNWDNIFTRTLFYSTNSYRRRDYTFHWQVDEPVCSDLQDRNFNSVQHVTIDSSPGRMYSISSFPNTKELTLKDDFNLPTHSIATILNRVIPLQRLEKLTIDYIEFSFEHFLELLRSAPNLHTVKFHFLSFAWVEEDKEVFKHVAKINQIRNLHIESWCDVEDIQLIGYLFPRLEHLQIEIYRRDFLQTARCLLSKTKGKLPHLTFLCVSEIPKVCLRELKMLIKGGKLLDHYVVQYLNQNLYLWW